MIVYKLFRQMKDGSLKSLFINKTEPLPVGEWLDAESHPTKGFKERRGWHALHSPSAPHLSMKGRVWRAVEIHDYTETLRPASQGGRWYLAERMRIIPINGLES